MSRVDVIVPCYNYGRFLRECVESVLTQPVDVRVLIIDDASTDDTPEVAAALAAEDARVEFRRHAVNRGHIATYNEGLEWVSGDYNLLLSADDLLVEGALLRASRLMDANPDVGLVYGRVVPFRSGNPRPAVELGEADDGWAIISGMEWLESLCRWAQTRLPLPRPSCGHASRRNSEGTASSFHIQPTWRCGCVRTSRQRGQAGISPSLLPDTRKEHERGALREIRAFRDQAQHKKFPRAQGGVRSSVSGTGACFAGLRSLAASRL